MKISSFGTETMEEGDTIFYENREGRWCFKILQTDWKSSTSSQTTIRLEISICLEEHIGWLLE